MSTLRTFHADPHGVQRYYTPTGERVKAGAWLPTHYAYVGVGDEVRLLVSDGPGPVDIWGQRVELTERGQETVKSLQGLATPGTYYTVHKVIR